MRSLEDDVALVTGASRGIGEGIAEGLGREGATVGVNHLPTESERERAEAVVAEIEDAGGTGLPLPADVSDEGEVRAMLDRFEDEAGTPDVLVNNAGVLSQSPLAEMDVSAWDSVVATNLRGTFLVTRFTLPGMLERGSGSIVNVASQLAFIGKENMAHYCASKGGIVSFTRALAREVAPDVRVNAIAPGPVETDLTSGRSAADNAARAESVPLKRLGNVDDVVPTALFLAGGESEYYTGQVLSPDGGEAMH
jgi:3-oxoacyl-[acyl-carrier protein] reductase